MNNRRKQGLTPSNFNEICNNGRATRIWLDLILKKELKKVIDWSPVDKEDYLSAIKRSVVKDVEIKVPLKDVLTDQINNRTLFMKNIDVSYY